MLILSGKLVYLVLYGGNLHAPLKDHLFIKQVIDNWRIIPFKWLVTPIYKPFGHLEWE